MTRNNIFLLRQFSLFCISPNIVLRENSCPLHKKKIISAYFLYLFSFYQKHVSCEKPFNLFKYEHHSVFLLLFPTSSWWQRKRAGEGSSTGRSRSCWGSPTSSEKSCTTSAASPRSRPKSGGRSTATCLELRYKGRIFSRPDNVPLILNVGDYWQVFKRPQPFFMQNWYLKLSFRCIPAPKLWVAARCRSAQQIISSS